MYKIMQRTADAKTELEMKRNCVQILQIMLECPRRLLNVQFLVPDEFVEYPSR